MKTIHAVLFGIGMLILVYLGVKNAPGVTSILSTGFSGTNTLVTTLQGR
jgi:hypothetical protein